MNKMLLKATLLLICVSMFDSVAMAEDRLQLQISVHDIKHTRGKLMLALSNHAEQFLSKDTKPFRSTVLDINNDREVWRLSDLTAGRYAVAVYHDENGNGQLDRNFIGIPSEPVGFSNNPEFSFGPPEFQQVVFEIKDKMTKIEIHLK